MRIVSCLDFKASLGALLSNYQIDFQTIIFGFRYCRLAALILFTNCLEEAFEEGYIMHTNGCLSRSVRREFFLHFTRQTHLAAVEFHLLIFIFKLDTHSIFLHQQTLQTHVN